LPGLSGRICQYLCDEFFRISANEYAASPRSPIPPLEGNDEMCNKIPLPRVYILLFLSADSILSLL
jgi:hypothetical protein